MRFRRVAMVMAAVLVTGLASVGVSTPSYAFVAGGGLGSLPSLNSPEMVRYYNNYKFAPGLLSNRALTEIILASGDSFDNICLVATNAGKTNTHLFRGTPSDQTLKCGLKGKALEASVESQASMLAGQVINSLDWSNAGVLACLGFLANWAELILTGAADYFRAFVYGTPWTAPTPAPEPGPGPGPGPQPDPSPQPDPVSPPAPDPNIDLTAARIQEQQPELDPGFARTIARTCVAYAAAAGDPTDRCLTDPIFIPGADAGAAAVHDAKVIAQVPEWYRLTYMSGKDKKDKQLGNVSDGWYESGRARRDGICPDKRQDRGVECDEYPFYTTLEGGPAAYTRTPFVLEEVPKGENRAEGNALQKMQEDPECNMAIPGKPRQTPGSGLQKFIVVPMAIPVPAAADIPTQYVGPPSFHLCRPATGSGGPVIIS